MLRAAFLLVLCLPALAVAQTPVAKGEIASLKRQGYVFYEGRWRLPQEIVYLQQAASRRFSATAPAAPAKAPAAESPQASPRERRHAGRRSTTTGLFTVRLQQVRVVGMDTVTVGVGTGTVRIQLPRTESVSIGTTVGLPLR
jgi:hypothetical protein